MNDPYRTFRDSWFYGAVCDHVAAFLRGDLPRIVCVQPPSTYKSGAWSWNPQPYTWIHAPWMRFLNISNETTLVTELSRKSRDVVQSPWYRATFKPDWTLRADQNTQQFFTNTKGGFRQGVSTGSAITGKKAHRIIVDDLHDAEKVKSPKERASDKSWFWNALMDRLIDTSGCVAVVGHRVDTNDIASECIKAGWPVLHLPEVWQEHFRTLYPAYPVQRRYDSDPREEGEYLREDFGPKDEEEVRSRGNGIWETKHQGLPQSAEGSLFPTEAVTLVRAIPIGTKAVRFWDTAASTKAGSSFTCGMMIGQQPNGRFLVCGHERKRLDFHKRDQLIANTAKIDHNIPGLRIVTTAIEHPGGSGGLQAAQILTQKLAGYVVEVNPVSGQGTKIYRAGPLSAQWIAGNVDVLEATWTKGFLERMETIHNSTEQDEMDACSGAFNRLVGKPSATEFIPAEEYTQEPTDVALDDDTRISVYTSRLNTNW